MRAPYAAVLKTLFHASLIEAKNFYDYTQAEMAEHLLMDPRSYIELDHGNSLCGTLTFVLYLVSVCPQPGRFLTSICDQFGAVRHSAVHISPYFLRLLDAASPQDPVPVTQILTFRGGNSFPVCPGCRITLDREYQRYCDRCGQALDWSQFAHAVIRRVP